VWGAFLAVGRISNCWRRSCEAVLWEQHAGTCESKTRKLGVCSVERGDAGELEDAPMSHAMRDCAFALLVWVTYGRREERDSKFYGW